MNSEMITIKEKANFIYRNSELIWSKIENPAKSEETVNNLQILLLCNYSLREDILICKELLQMKDSFKLHDDSYNASMKIFFYMANFLNENSILVKNKEALKDRLRQYTKFIPATHEELIKNNEFVKLYKKRSK